MTKKIKLPPKSTTAKAASLKSKSAKTTSKSVAAAKSPPAKPKSAPPPKLSAKPTASAVQKPAAKPAVVAKPAKEVRKPETAKAAPVVPVVASAPAPTPQRAMPAQGSKPAEQRLTAPAQVKPAPAKQAVAAPAPVADAAKKTVTSRHGFKTSELIVYPAHGVGRIIGIEEQEIAGISLELFVIEFEKDKMTLRVPTSKPASVGMRKLAEDGVLKKAMDTLKGKARIKRTMWSRRAQEYEAKINSGDLIAIAEVVRDLYRSEAQPEQSYSERQLYEAALDRMSRELAAVDHSDERSAMQRITEVLAKSARGRRTAEEQSGEPEADGTIRAA